MRGPIRQINFDFDDLLLTKQLLRVGTSHGTKTGMPGAHMTMASFISSPETAKLPRIEDLMTSGQSDYHGVNHY